MAVYEYQAMADTGKAVKGVIEADSPAAARRKLREQSLFPTKVAESFTKGKDEGALKEGGARVKARDLSMFTRQLAVLLDSGMPLVAALNAVLDQTSNVRLRKIVYDVRGKVNEGSSLADALAAHPRYFADMYQNMVRAGEASGTLEKVLFRLADLQERQIRLAHHVRSALMYPILMVLVATALISLMMVFVIPKITTLFERQKMDLPLMTRILVGTSDFITNRWWLLLLIVFALFTIWRAWIARPQGRLAWDRLRLRMPVLGDIYLRTIAAQYARTLGTMLESGLTMMVSLDVVKMVMANRVFSEVMDTVRSEVRRGRDLSAPMRDAAVFPPMLIHMVELGERSGQLEDMLMKVADTYEEEVEMAVDGLVSLLEPVMILVMGGFVLFLVLAILLPIFNMTRGFG